MEPVNNNLNQNPQNTSQQGPDMNTDEAAAALGFVTSLSEKLMTPQQEQPQQDTSNNLDLGQVEQKPEEPESPTKNTTEGPENNEIEAKVSELEKTMNDEVMTLRREIEKEGIKAEIKAEYEKKITDLEAKRKKEIDGLKKQVKDILNG